MLAVCAIKSKEQTIRKKMYPPAPPPLFKLVWHAAKPLVALPALDLLLIGHFAENCFFSVWQICVFRNGIKRFYIALLEMAFHLDTVGTCVSFLAKTLHPDL